MPGVHVASGATIALFRLHRNFGAVKAVNDISFEVHRGQVFGYIGPNGAGKTTSMRILATLELPSAGDAYVDGFSVVNDPDAVRRRLGFMPDYFGAYANVNCTEYLDFFARSYGLRGTQRLVALDRVMKFTGLDVLAHKPTAGLSKGMKQRLCLGRALIHDPQVLILDEPAAGLDPRARIQLRNMIRQLGAEGKTVLISSHILTELAEMCDSVGIIEQGRLIANGAVADIERQARTHNEVEVKVQVLERAEELAAWLRSQPNVAQVNVADNSLMYTHQGDRRSEAEMLRNILAAGFEVCGFGVKEINLEDVFMQVTKGAVQ